MPISITQAYQICPISQENIKDFLTKTELKIFMLLSDVSRYCSKVYMTREIIAKRVGCCEKTVSRATSKLNKLGLIRKYRKFIGKIEKCSYKIMPKYIGIFKKEVKKFLDAGKKFAIRILQSVPLQIENVPVVNSLNNYIYIKDNIKETYSVSNRSVLTDGNNCKDISTLSSNYLLRKPIDYHPNLKKVEEERGSDMYNKNDNILITTAIKEATEILDLTKNGQATLRAYPDEVILMMLLKVMKSQSDDPFQMLMNECDKYCKEKRIVICWTRSYSLKEAYGINKDDRYYTNKKTKTSKGEKVSYRTKSNEPRRPYDPDKEKYGELSNRMMERDQQRFEEREERRAEYWHQQDLLAKQKDTSSGNNLPF